MIKKTLYFGNPCYLSLSNCQLVLRFPAVEKNDLLPDEFKKEAKATIPVEDIGIVVLDNKQITITNALLSELLENNVAVISCNNTHHPNGLFLTLSGNTIQTERYKIQIEASEPLKKQMWAQIIEQKIKNQSYVLKKRNIDYSYLLPLIKSIKSGDSDNCEATAAAYYWQNLFKEIMDFKRHREGMPPNNLLNYGYAILRATMARSIVGAGLLPTLGIHHSNKYNAYCLADDLMEPYRPFVDNLVCDMIKNKVIPEELKTEHKAELLKIPVIDVMLDGEKSPLMIATKRTASSLYKCFEGTSRKLLVPVFLD